jgi:hypothetical protein
MKQFQSQDTQFQSDLYTSLSYGTLYELIHISVWHKHKYNDFAQNINKFICSIESRTRCTLYVFFISLYFARHVSGAIYTHPLEHKLQHTATGVCNGYSMLTQWSRYWLGHPHTFSTVKSELVHAKSVRVTQPVPAPMD